MSATINQSEQPDELELPADRELESSVLGHAARVPRCAADLHDEWFFHLAAVATPGIPALRQLHEQQRRAVEIGWERDGEPCSIEVAMGGGSSVRLVMVPTEALIDALEAHGSLRSRYDAGWLARLSVDGCARPSDPNRLKHLWLRRRAMELNADLHREVAGALTDESLSDRAARLIRQLAEVLTDPIMLNGPVKYSDRVFNPKGLTIGAIRRQIYGSTPTHRPSDRNGDAEGTAR